MRNLPRIAIIGAGPGGPTLARVLHVKGLKCTIFEADSHALARPQGGTLDLDPASGQFALEQAGLIEEFRRLARYEDQGMRLLDKHGNVYLDDPGDPSGNRPEIDRSQLREMLSASLPPDAVKWGYKLQEVQSREEGVFRLVFTSGTAGPFDLVVGADGAWSVVRPLVSRYAPQYTGVSFIELGINHIDTLHPSLSKLVGHGTMAAYGDAKGLIAQRNAGAHVRVYACLRVREDWPTLHFDFLNPDNVRGSLLDIFHDWMPELRDLIRVSDDQVQWHAIHALPVGHYWINRKGVTLLGDAAHLMSPYGGSGVNNAMRDAAELGCFLSESGDWEEAVKAYESDMFERVLGPAQFAANGIAVTLSHMQLELALQSIRGPHV